MGKGAASTAQGHADIMAAPALSMTVRDVEALLEVCPQIQEEQPQPSCPANPEKQEEVHGEIGGHLLILAVVAGVAKMRIPLFVNAV